MQEAQATTGPNIQPPLPLNTDHCPTAPPQHQGDPSPHAPPVPAPDIPPAPALPQVPGPLQQHALGILLQHMPEFSEAYHNNLELAFVMILQVRPGNLLSMDRVRDAVAHAHDMLPRTQGGTHIMHNRWALAGVDVSSYYGHSFQYWPPSNLWQFTSGGLLPTTNSWLYMPLILFAMGHGDIPLPTHLMPPHHFSQIQAAIQLLRHEFNMHGVTYQALSPLMDGPGHYPAIIQEALMFLNPIVGMWATQFAHELAQSVHPQAEAQGPAMQGTLNPLIALLATAGLVTATMTATRPMTGAERVRVHRASQNEEQ